MRTFVDLLVCNQTEQQCSVDEKILQHMIDSQSEFIMEVTDKTKADIKVTGFSTAMLSFNQLIVATRVVLSSTTTGLFVFSKSPRFPTNTLRTSSRVRHMVAFSSPYHPDLSFSPEVQDL